MMTVYLLIIAFSAFVFSLAATVFVRFLLQKMQVMDHPEERSNHALPVPRGGGLAVVGTILAFLLVVRVSEVIWLAVLFAAILSFMDDLHRLSVRFRLPVHIALAALVVSVIKLPVFQGLLPLWLDKAGAIVLLVGFMNIFNFMDGIDEISVMSAVTLCFGLMICEASIHGLPRGLQFDGMIVAASMLGFWVLNRHPAKIFLGDVGSIPIGLLLGYFLLMAASQGFWAAALILPAYYILDATLTLLMRLSRGENITQSHSSHAYQRAVRRGLTHPQVVEAIFALNLVLMVLALAASKYPEYVVPAVAAAYGLALLLIGYFRTRPMRAEAVAHAPEAAA